MFILFGNRHINKILGETSLFYKCKHCGNARKWTIKRESIWFTLFFIPIFQFKITYTMRCPICNSGILLTKEQALEKMNEVNEKNIDAAN